MTVENFYQLLRKMKKCNIIIKNRRCKLYLDHRLKVNSDLKRKSRNNPANSWLRSACNC